jgi:sulfonate transport system substrate-binding protein
MRKTRRRFLQGAAGFVGGCTLGSAAAAAASATVSFSYQQSSALLITLKARGMLDGALAAKSCVADWHQFSRIVDAMSSNAVDFHGDVADAVPVFAQASGAPLMYYAREAPSPTAEAIIVHAASPVTSIAGLKGKRIGVSRGSGCHYLVIVALKRVGLTLDDVQVAYLEAADGGAAFGRGDLDAWAIWDPYLAITESRVPVRKLADGSGGNSDYNRFYMVSQPFAEAHPDIVQIVFDALVGAGTWLRANPAAGAQLLAPLWGGVPASVIETVNRRRSFDVRPITPDALAQQQRIADAFYGASILPEPLDAAHAPFWKPAG